MITIKSNKKVDVNEYIKLLKSAGWKVLSTSQHQKALDNSMIVVVAYDEDKVIGLARIVGDSSTHGLLCDVVVLPEYQGKGIGKRILNNLILEVKNNLNKDEEFLIELLPANGKRDFYIKCGFKYKPENMDGMYLWIKEGDNK